MMLKMRFPRGTLALLVVLSLARTSVFAGGAQWERLREKYLGLRSLAGNFIERLNPAEGDTETVFEGEFAFELPNRFRLQVLKPVRQSIVGNDSLVWFYFPDEKRAVLQRRAEPLPLLAFIEPLLDTATVINEERAPGDKKVISLEPRKETFFRDMKLELDKAGVRVQAFSFVDDWGNKYHIILKSQRWNPTLPRKLFRFVPPPGTTVESQ